MSEGKDKLEKELIEAFKEVVLFLDEHRNREISIVQTRILLNSKMNLVVKNLNSFIQEVSHSAEYKIDVIFKVLETASHISLRIPEVPELEKVRIEYLSLANFLRMVLANLHQDSDKAQSYSTASILSHLLIDDIQRMEGLPKLPKVENDPFPFFDILIPLSNNLQSTWGIYNTLISYLSVIIREDLEDWTDQVLWNFKLFKEMYSQFDVLKLLQTRKIKKAQVFLDNVHSISMTYMNMAVFMLELHLKYGGEWPEKLDSYGLVDDFSLKSFEKLLHTTLHDVDQKMNALKEAFNLHYLTRNDDPEKHEGKVDLNIFKNEFKILLNVIKFYTEGDRNDLAVVEQIIKGGREVLDEIITIVGGKEKLLESYYLTTYLLVLQEMLPFVAQKAVLLNSITIFEDFRFDQRFILETFSVEIDTGLYFMKEICKLYVRTYFKQNINFDKIITQLTENLKFFYLKPRIYLSISVLLMVLSYLGLNTDAEMRLRIVHDIEEKEMLKYQISETVTDYRKYIDLIEKIDFGEQVSFNFPKRMQIKELDHFSWLIPDFSHYFKMIERKEVKYFPFNLGSDSVIDSREDDEY